MGGHLFKQINRRNSISKEEKSLIDVNGSAESEYPGFNYHRFVFFFFCFFFCASAVEGFSSRPFIFHFFPNRTDLLVNTNNFFPLEFDFLVFFTPRFDSSEDIHGNLHHHENLLQDPSVFQKLLFFRICIPECPKSLLTNLLLCPLASFRYPVGNRTTTASIRSFIGFDLGLIYGFFQVIVNWVDSANPSATSDLRRHSKFVGHPSLQRWLRTGDAIF